MGALIPRSYLIIARYTRDSWEKWKDSEFDRKTAHSLAEQLFPDERNSVDLPDEGSVRLPNLGFLRLARSFYTGFHSQIKAKEADGKSIGQATEEVFANPPKKLPDEDEDDPGIGWMAVVDESYYLSFLELMGQKAGPLAQLYKFEVIPLNNDQSTDDIYKYMTPSNWKT